MKTSSTVPELESTPKATEEAFVCGHWSIFGDQPHSTFVL
jgi:hypothetical protein